MSNASNIPDHFLQKLDSLLSHLWMVRTFLKHCEEAEEDEEVAEVHRQLYDYAHAVGIHMSESHPSEAFRFAKKKFRRLREATELFEEIQEEVSGHMNFKMANKSLRCVTDDVNDLLQSFSHWKSEEKDK